MNNKQRISRPLVIAIVVFGMLLISTEAFAAISNAGVMDTVLNRFKSNASSWANIIETAATRLFWTLVLISMVITFGMMALQKADIGEFFAEFVRFTLFTGFFWWLLINGPNFAMSIIDSLMRLGGNAAAMGGYAGSFSPSSIVDIGFILFGKALVESSIWSPVDSVIGMILGLGILVLTALIAVNMLLLLISAWILSYGGIFFLGFGGARWTSDMAINYYKAVLGIAIQIMTMVLLIGIGVSLINDYYINMQTNIEFSEMAVVLIVTLTIFILSNKVPQLLSSIITGHVAGGMGIGQVGAGAALGATATAAAATAMAGSMIAAGATQGAGGMSALMAAFSQANANMAAGSDVLANTFGGGNGSDGGSSGPGSGGGSPPGTGDTPFAKAAGFSGQTGSDGDSTQAFAQSADNSSGHRDNNKQGESDPGGKNEKVAGNGGQMTERGSGNTGGGIFATAGSAAATATRIGADAATNLARGTADVAKAKIGSMVESAKDRIADTTGGRIADAIRTRGAESAAAFDGNSLASVDNDTDVDAEAEIAAFVNRDNDSQSA